MRSPIRLANRNRAAVGSLVTFDRPRGASRFARVGSRGVYSFDVARMLSSPPQLVVTVEPESAAGAVEPGLDGHPQVDLVAKPQAGLSWRLTWLNPGSIRFNSGEYGGR